MKRILIVDDLKDNRYLLEKMLQGSGYEVTAVSNGAEALAAAAKVPPDLVISDILMPVMDGFTLCREWMKDAALCQSPFIFYTATYTDQKDEQFALSLGAARFLVKPMETGVFLGVIRTVLTEYEKGRLAPPASAGPEEEVFLKQYNEALIRKLEDKLAQVENAEKFLRQANEKLEGEIAVRRQAEATLTRQLRELQNWHQVALDREDRVRELKEEVNALLAAQGRPPKYLI